jgi:hypothetical protein
MTIYIVQYSYSWEILGVFDSEEKAEDFIKQKVRESNDVYDRSYFNITEAEVE